VATQKENRNKDTLLEYQRPWCPGRRKQLGDLRQTRRVDIVCLQETIKGDFTLGELAGLSEGGSFEWVWTAAKGHSGGTLIGVRTDDIIVLTKDKGEYFTSMKVTGKQENFTWEVINVYGPVQIERKTAFLEELTNKISSTEDPFLTRGDFNMIRFPWEKSSDNTSNTWMDNFNNFIRDNGVKEMNRKGSKFTWSNKQENPVMSVLDRVLMSPSWEQFYKNLPVKL
jgi:exonuclease III